MVDEVVERVQLVARQKGVRVVVGDVSAASVDNGAPLRVLADRERLLQLLTIFIDNAIDHSPPDGTVTVRARATADGSRAVPRVIVEVMDQGPGVPPAERERIFEPFAQIDGPTSDRRHDRTWPGHRADPGLAPERHDRRDGCAGRRGNLQRVFCAGPGVWRRNGARRMMRR